MNNLWLKMKGTANGNLRHDEWSSWDCLEKDQRNLELDGLGKMNF